MESFCRGCLIQYEDPIELLQYTEKYRRLFVYSTGLQVKRNDTIIFQLCKECFINMKAACKFKKTCRASDKKFKSYVALKDVGDGIDFCTFIRNSDDAMVFSLPHISGNSTPANQKSRDDDNESTCTSIRNFMTDILQGQEMPDTEARIIKEVIEEEADVLDDSLDSHWLQDDASIDTDFRLDFSFSPFGTPHSINNDHCYTPKQYLDYKDEQPRKYFTSISSARQHKTANDFTEVIRNNLSEKELCVIQEDINTKTIENNIINNERDINTKTIEHDILNNEDEINNLSLPMLDDEKSINNLDIPSIDSEKLINNFDLPEIDDGKSLNSFIPAIVKEVKNINLELVSADSNKSIIDLSMFDNNEIINNVKSIDNDKLINSLESKSLNVKNFYVPNNYSEYLNASKEIESLVNEKATIKTDKEKQCTIDVNLEKALEDVNTKEICLNDLLVTPRGPSAASTPMITNLLFGTKLELETSNNTNKYMKKIENMEIFEELFRDQDNKELDSDLKVESITEDKTNEHNMDIDEVDASTDIKPKLKSKKEADITSYDLENFKCNLCDIKYKSYKALAVHFGNKHHVKIKKTEGRKPRQRMCSICGKKLADRQTLYKHLKSHKKQDEDIQVKCKTCGLEFLKSKLSKHMNSHYNTAHTKGKGKFVCSVCGATSTTIGNFRVHQRRHTNNYKHICLDCGKGFYRLSDLTVHTRTHTGAKPFSCPHCDKAFARKNLLTRHVKFHIDDKPYQCEHCKRTFPTNNKLTSHIRLSKRCMKLRGIVFSDEEIESIVDEKEEDSDHDIDEAPNIEEPIVIICQLPYIDTEMSN